MTSSIPSPPRSPSSTTGLPPLGPTTSSTSTGLSSPESDLGPELAPEEIEEAVRSLLGVVVAKANVNPEECRALLSIAQDAGVDPEALWSGLEATRSPDLGPLPDYATVAPSGATEGAGLEGLDDLGLGAETGATEASGLGLETGGPMDSLPGSSPSSASSDLDGLGAGASSPPSPTPPPPPPSPRDALRRASEQGNRGRPRPGGPSNPAGPLGP